MEHGGSEASAWCSWGVCVVLQPWKRVKQRRRRVNERGGKEESGI